MASSASAWESSTSSTRSSPAAAEVVMRDCTARPLERPDTAGTRDASHIPPGVNLPLRNQAGLGRRRPHLRSRWPCQGEVEGRAFAQAAVRPDPPAVAGHDPVHDRKSDAGALELLHGMQPLEEAEELRRIAHVEAHAVIAYVVDALRALLQRPDFDPGGIAPGRELQRVGEQVDPHLLEQSRIGTTVGQLADLHAYGARARGF